MNGHPIGYDERTMAILRGLLMARNDWRECLEVTAYALVGYGLGDQQQIAPAHVIYTQPMPDHELPRLSCGHLRTSLRHWRNSASGLTGDWCSECEVERVGSGNGG